MTKRVDEIIFGIDVSKDELVIFCWQTEQLQRLPNEAAAIQSWLKSLNGPASMAIEATSDYHLAVIDQAHALGHTVYLVNGRQLAHYREAVNLRHKSDPDDAWLLARFLAHEGAQLRPFAPHSRNAQELWQFIKRRAVVVETRKQLQQSLAGTAIGCQALMTQMRALLRRIERRIRELIRKLGWNDDYQRCLTIPGVGPINGAALVCAYHRGAFAGSDDFIAYLGLDIKRRRSGHFKGQEKLSKRGESELRRLLYCAAKPARSYPPFERFYQAQLEKGLSKTAASMILGRKIARIAFSLLTKQQTFIKQDIAYS
ncbi:MAG TPA: transposase [Woeseiaceae bacterium]|nr:transposase [Woeseiaceae bacterium]